MNGHRYYIIAVKFSGDLFDEGQWAESELWDRFVQTFHSIFNSGEIPVFAAIGNHDVGFHYAISPRRLEWFHKSFSTDLVRLIDLKGNYVILLNSMAMEGDNCRLCAEAESQLQKISRTFNCMKSTSKSSNDCSTDLVLNSSYCIPQNNSSIFIHTMVGVAN